MLVGCCSNSTALLRSTPVRHQKPSGSSPKLFSFGIISDVQFADIEDGASFGGVPRFYRASLHSLQRAVQGWRQRELAFGIHFGDIVDGFCPKEWSHKALRNVLDEFDELGKPVWHMLGNHCLYNLPRETLNTELQLPQQADGSSYYSFSPHRDWRFIVLDGYDVSLLGWPEGHPLHQEAKAVLRENNPNAEKNSPEGLIGVSRRFVKFGGGLSKGQLSWLKDELSAAKDQQQKVIVCCHLCIHPDTCNTVCLLWNYDELLRILGESGNVVATFSGHAHRDGYACDEYGVHHRVLKGVVETPPLQDCYGWVEVYTDRLEVVGVGTLTSMSLPFPLSACQAVTKSLDALTL